METRYCTATDQVTSLVFTSPVLMQHAQDITYYAPYCRQCGGVRLSERSLQRAEQTATTSLHRSSCVDSLALRALIRPASGKGGSRNTENGVTTRALPEGLLKLSHISV